eukprot:UN14889
MAPILSLPIFDMLGTFLSNTRANRFMSIISLSLEQSPLKFDSIFLLFVCRLQRFLRLFMRRFTMRINQRIIELLNSKTAFIYEGIVRKSKRYI